MDIRQDGMRHRGQGDALEDYYVYNLPVIAPAAGIVRSAVDGEPDKLIGVSWRGGNPAGNHIVLEVAPNQYLYFYNYRCEGRIIERGIPTGGEVEQVVENVPF